MLCILADSKTLEGDPNAKPHPTKPIAHADLINPWIAAFTSDDPAAGCVHDPMIAMLTILAPGTAAYDSGFQMIESRSRLALGAA